MKILAINGSHRGRRGHTAYLLDRLFTGARAAGAECEEETLATLELRRCLACARCQEEGFRFQCVHDGEDDVRGVFHKIGDADLVVWASPVYVFGLSSLLRTFLERFFCIGDTADLCVSPRCTPPTSRPVASWPPPGASAGRRSAARTARWCRCRCSPG